MEAKKIAAMAETRWAQIAPHLYCGPLVTAANVQIAACSPNFLILESIGRFDHPFMDFVTTSMAWEDGYVIPPDTSGLGIGLNDVAFAAHPYTGAELHLESATAAVVP